jgi:HD-GYP domain-containing protein (c-di-GMP phosphodiesterase class II)
MATVTTNLTGIDATPAPRPDNAAAASRLPALPPPVAPAALENLAVRFRPCGLSVALLNVDGSLAWADDASGTFFQRFVLPQIQYPQAEGQALRAALEKITPQSSVMVLGELPGAAIAVFPYVDKRRVAALFVLAGKSVAFKLSEDVVRVCGRLGLDAVWLDQQAAQLPAFDSEGIQRHARLLLTMVRDQVRLASLEGELDGMSTQLTNSYEELTLIYSLAGGTNVTRRPSEFFKQACLEVLQVVDVRGLGVALSPESMQSNAPVLYGSMVLPPGTVQRLSEELIARLRRRPEPILVPRLAGDRAFGWLSEHAQQLLAVPMLRQETLLGCLFAMDKKSGEFDTEDSKLLSSIANESAIYLENARLFEDVHGLLMGLLHSLTSAVDAKDAYTCGHSERVALLSRLLATQCGLDDAQVERIYMAGLLHDVGKIGVPERVLQKAGKLTDEEFALMKKHPEIGARILRDIRQVADILPGVLHHHERYDGRGYPAGLAGKNIPLMGRLICVADCFDAMTSNRTYRQALPLEVALTEMRRCAGTQFDPELIDAFLRIGEEPLRELLRNHREESQRLLLLAGMPPGQPRPSELLAQVRAVSDAQCAAIASDELPNSPGVPLPMGVVTAQASVVRTEK